MFLVSFCSCLRSIHWSQVLSWEWRCSWSSADSRCSNYIWIINNFYCLLRCDLYYRFYGHILGNYWNHNKMSVSIESADVLALKHQAISIHNTDPILVFPKQFHNNGHFQSEETWNQTFILKKTYPVIWVKVESTAYTGVSKGNRGDFAPLWNVPKMWMEPPPAWAC